MYVGGWGAPGALNGRTNHFSGWFLGRIRPQCPMTHTHPSSPLGGIGRAVGPSGCHFKRHCPARQCARLAVGMRSGMCGSGSVAPQAQCTRQNTWGVTILPQGSLGQHQQPRGRHWRHCPSLHSRTTTRGAGGRHAPWGCAGAALGHFERTKTQTEAIFVFYAPALP